MAVPDLADFWLYHRAVRDFRGEELLPLNALRDVHPEVYGREVAKYVGREQLQAERVLPLDCLWGDVLFFSPVHPQALLDAVRASGRQVPPLRFWALNAAALRGSATCIKFVRPWPGGVYTLPQEEEYTEFSPAALKAACVPSATTLARLRGLPPDAPLVLWSDVPHVLHRGAVLVESLREVWC